MALMRRIVDTTALPSAIERIDRALLHLAELGPGVQKQLNAKHCRAVLGCENSEQAQWVIEQAIQLGYVSPNGALGTGSHNALTAAGWKRCDELQRTAAGSKHAFMAMKFSDDMFALLRDHLQPAVAQTGFELRTLAGSHKTAGLIDNRMRVEIRTSRFIVCDLTDSNRGAYWEAGFAEGLGRQVFYICRRDVLSETDREKRPHFDTDHQQIVAWSIDTIADDMAELKAVIRNTLPAEARMEDAK
jgi:hypothetical protein